MKLHLFGASGSGVTTLGNALAAQLNIPYFDSDAYFWESTDPPFTIRRNAAQRNALIRADLDKQPDWMVGGSIINWGDTVFPSFDLIVFLWLPPEVRMARLLKREQERYGDRISLNPDRKKQHQEFLAWAADYDHDTGIATRTLNAHEQWMQKQTAPVLELRGDKTIRERTHEVIVRLRTMNVHF
ncbi:P-loop NTPase family protein [Chitinophaga arvensicola]|uniref:Adenylate kinase n=1 Tax=Chitinophaga arvensicola TaxID=29529 RepID=A0A1I0RNB3_9BACT|nr:adenylate kinase [Chitinophaga arvensicola]SEW42675.1 Adenylate kinase [Chitinophaga arvensicola]